jgi:phosphopantetheine--protein transferase-like protein
MSLVMMSPSIGIDLVEIKRFTHWHSFQDTQLRKLFSHHELAYCRAVLCKSAERFAVRFAAKEALFKSLSAYGRTTVPLLKLFRHIELILEPSGVVWNIDWVALGGYYTLPSVSDMSISTSLTHTGTTAGAVVIITFLS